MKFRVLFFLIISGFSGSVYGQFKTPPIDQSPMDMSYFPPGYAQLKAQGKAQGQPIIRLIYSRPQKKSREIFGQQLPFGKLWRAGANEATEIYFLKDVVINQKTIPSGRYTFYIIPELDKWTIILNSRTDIWGEGPSKYEQSEDVLRMEVPVETLDIEIEAWAMFFQKTDTGANLVMAWDKTKATLPIVITN